MWFSYKIPDLSECQHKIAFSKVYTHKISYSFFNDYLQTDAFGVLLVICVETMFHRAFTVNTHRGAARMHHIIVTTKAPLPVLKPIHKCREEPKDSVKSDQKKTYAPKRKIPFFTLC